MTVSSPSTEGITTFSTRAERYAAGKALSAKAPRTSDGEWASASNRPDPIRLLEESNCIRVPELVPFPYGRMTGTRPLKSRITESFSSCSLSTVSLCSAKPYQRGLFEPCDRKPLSAIATRNWPSSAGGRVSGSVTIQKARKAGKSILSEMFKPAPSRQYRAIN